MVSNGNDGEGWAKDNFGNVVQSRFSLRVITTKSKLLFIMLLAALLPLFLAQILVAAENKPCTTYDKDGTFYDLNPLAARYIGVYWHQPYLIAVSC